MLACMNSCLLITVFYSWRLGEGQSRRCGRVIGEATLANNGSELTVGIRRRERVSEARKACIINQPVTVRVVERVRPSGDALSAISSGVARSSARAARCP